jgi:hypothetical protein
MNGCVGIGMFHVEHWLFRGFQEFQEFKGFKIDDGMD